MSGSSRGRTALAVIPARGGSKRVPKKNVRDLSGRPMISWAIETAIRSGQFSEVVVTTDDEEIATIARSAGATTPFLRPSDLADDHSGTLEVVRHAVAALTELGIERDDVCCIYPTAVFISPVDLASSRERLDSSEGAPFVVSVLEYPHPIQRAFALDSASHLIPIDQSSFGVRTQDLEVRFHDAGQFYWGSRQAWLTATSILGHAEGFPLPRGRVVDIDSEDDLATARGLHALKMERAKAD